MMSVEVQHCAKAPQDIILYVGIQTMSYCECKKKQQSSV